MHRLTIVIPTYNRSATLEKAISGYFGQTALPEIAEIIVVDDGSTDSTPDIVNRLAHNPHLPIRYFRQANQGPAAARNRGIREATGDLILFTDDDIIPRSTLVAEHLAWHARFPQWETAVLGNVAWAPEMQPTPFMRWYGSDGPLFAYAHFADGNELDYVYFYTCNLSLKTNFLRQNGVFDEDFKAAAFEDVELGYRLKKAGLRLLYNSNAVAYHWQSFSFNEACHRARRVASANEIFAKKEAARDFYGRRKTAAIFANGSLRHFKEPLNACRRQLARLLSPLKSLMDSRFPLPWGVYRTMFRIYR